MKRSWIGLGLLVLLLILSWVSALAMVRLHAPVEDNLNQAAQCALLGDWVNTEAFFRRGKEKWETLERFRACFADQTPVEEIDGQFALLEIYCLTQERSAFTASCRELAEKCAAVGEAHEMVWWNLF